VTLTQTAIIFVIGIITGYIMKNLGLFEEKKQAKPAGAK